MIAYREWSTAPNLVTLARVLLTPAIVWCIVRGLPVWAASVFALAAFTDFLDGQLARAHSDRSSLGKYLDPIADKILLSGVFVALAIEGSAPLWYVELVFGRDLALVIASAIAMRVSTYSNYSPTFWGKLSTLLQILTAVAFILTNAIPSLGMRELANGCLIVSGVATGWSAIHYTWRGIAYFVKR